MLLTNGAAAREPRRISPILAQVATSGSGSRLFREQRFGAYRANSALNEGQAVKQRVEKVRHQFPAPQTDLEILSTWLTGKLLTPNSGLGAEDGIVNQFLLVGD
jgi:hypothetical protein